MRRLEELIPDEPKKAAVASGNEFAFKHSDALIALQIAAQYNIAVLGLEIFEKWPDGLYANGVSTYDANYELSSDWARYVEIMNFEAGKWLAANKEEGNYVYVLTSATADELAEANRLITRKEGLIARLRRYLR